MRKRKNKGKTERQKKENEKEKGKTEKQKAESGKQRAENRKQKTENRKQKAERINVRSEYRNAVGIVKVGVVLGLQNNTFFVIIGSGSTESIRRFYGEDGLWGSLH